MTPEDEIAAVENATIAALEPYREILSGLLTLLEGCVDRIEVLELELLHKRRARAPARHQKRRQA